jgi:hypothetical protein
MGRGLDQVIAELPPERQQRIDTRYRELKQEVEGLRELRRIGVERTMALERVPIICTHSLHDGSSWRPGGRSAVERMNRWRGRGEE